MQTPTFWFTARFLAGAIPGVNGYKEEVKIARILFPPSINKFLGRVFFARCFNFEKTTTKLNREDL